MLGVEEGIIWQRIRNKIGTGDNVNFGFLCMGFPNGR